MENENRLKVFVTAATAGSITRTASILSISQPAVSRHIMLLESDVGCALFRRHGRGIDLTEDGQRFYEVVSPALNRINAMVGQLQDSSKSVSGQLRIASIHTLNSYFVMPILKNALDMYPALSLQILERSSLDVGNLVERGLADIGLAYDTMIASEVLHSIRLHDEHMQLIHSQHDESSLSQQLNENGELVLGKGLKFVTLPSGYALRQMLDNRLGLNMKSVIQVETIDLMLKAVHSGLGVCVLPNCIPRHMVEERGLFRKDIAPPEMSRTIVVITRSKSTTVPAIAHMTEEFIKASKRFIHN